MRQEVAVVDIDGVLCDNIERQRAHIAAGAPVGENSIEWESFADGYLEDPPRPEYVALVQMIRCPIVLLTCRHERHRDVTDAWLEKHGITYHELVMWDPDLHGYYQHKEVAIDELRRIYAVQVVIEDSLTHTRMFRERGLPVVYVSDGLSH